jgi:S-adenosylmethionine:tRNA ribosyltransferase-isomerase
MLRTSALEYELPEGVIATAPAEPRDSARLMVLWRSDPSRVEHARVADLPRFFGAGDTLIVNTTRVLRARLLGVREDTGGKVQGLYLGNAATHERGAHGGESLRADVGGGSGGGEARRWIVMLQGKSLRAGVWVVLRAGEGEGTREVEGAGGGGLRVRLRLVERDAHEHAAWIVEVDGGGGEGGAGLNVPGPVGDSAILERVGLTPLPPYIVKARASRGEVADEAYDRARYQTVYARGLGEGVASDGERGGAGRTASPIAGDVGSVAAPTAGLHLTPGVLGALDACGVRRAGVVLHVGSGTFKPVEAEFVQQHQMHTEWCSLGGEAWGAIAATRGMAAGAAEAPRGRVICVGTTSARTVESFARAHAAGPSWSPEAWLPTDLLIAPGYRWRWTDGLLTNFHLPRSTLLAMVGSLLDPPGLEEEAGRREDGGAGLSRLKTAYAEAIARGYRFFSYGDAMLILP